MYAKMNSLHIDKVTQMELSLTSVGLKPEGQHTEVIILVVSVNLSDQIVGERIELT